MIWLRCKLLQIDDKILCCGANMNHTYIQCCCDKRILWGMRLTPWIFAQLKDNWEIQKVISLTALPTGNCLFESDEEW